MAVKRRDVDVRIDQEIRIGRFVQSLQDVGEQSQLVIETMMDWS